MIVRILAAALFFSPLAAAEEVAPVTPATQPPAAQAPAAQAPATNPAAPAAAPAAPANPADAPLDVREAPFANGDWNWLNGQNRQPNSLLVAGPVTVSMLADVYYAFQFSNPIDNTIFPGTTAPRHNEIALNLVTVGAEVTGLDGPIGRVVLQAGDNVETDAGQDPTGQRGFYLSQRALAPIQQAAGGWHFHVLHGLNIEGGLLLSYVGLESYVPEENWNYTHSFLSDFTPYYFSGIRTQLYTSQDLKLEFWVVNGWQTNGEWHETKALGELIHWRPSELLAFTHNIYIGHEERDDPHALRLYTDNNAQIRYLKNLGFLDSGAIALVGDLGYEHRSLTPSGAMGGASIGNRFESGKFALTVRADFFYDATQALIQQLPQGSPYSLPDKGAFLGGGFTATFDFWPSPWLLCRVEYSHRAANIPYFSGPGGITGPGGVAASDPSTFTPDLRNSDDRIVVNATLRL